MTEVEWVASSDPMPMLEFLQGTSRVRRLRLFLVACARLGWDRLAPGTMREAVEVAERFADGLASDEERQRLSTRMWSIPVEYGREISGNWFQVRPREDVSAYMSAMLSVGRISDSRITSRPTWQEGRRTSGPQQPGLLREFFGNPFRPVAFHPAWRTSDVLLLAQGIYEEKAFDREPILADALQDAGCNSNDILNHLRDATASHVRGCWALDLVLGKE